LFLDQGAHLAAQLGPFRPIDAEHAVEQRDLGSHLNHLAARGIVRGFGRAHEQAQEQGRHGGDKTHRQFHGVPAVRAQVMLWKEAAKPHTDPHGGEQAG